MAGGIIGSLFTNKDAKAAAAMKSQGLQTGFASASQYLNQGTDKAVGRYDAASERFDPLFDTASAGYGAYGDASGAGGAAGFDRAMELYRSSPYYRSGLNTGLEALDRRAAGRGQLNSGNNTQDTLRFASELEDQNYGQFLSGLTPYLSQAPSIAGIQGGYDTGVGDLYANQGANLANLAWQRDTGIGDANASAQLAKRDAAGNVFSAVTGGINLAGKLVGLM